MANSNEFASAIMSAPDNIINLCLNENKIFNSHIDFDFKDDYSKLLNFLEDLDGKVTVNLYGYKSLLKKIEPILKTNNYIFSEKNEKRSYYFIKSKRDAKISFFSIITEKSKINFKDLELFCYKNNGFEQQLEQVEELNKDKFLLNSFSLPSYGMKLFVDSFTYKFSKKVGGSLQRSFRNIFPLLDNYSDLEKKIIDMETSPYLFSAKNESDQKYNYYEIDFNSYYPSFLYFYKLPFGKPINICTDQNEIKKLLNVPCEKGGYSYDEKKPWPFHNSYPNQVRHFYYIKFKKLENFPFKTFDFLEYEEGETVVIAEALYFIENYINVNKRYVDWSVIAIYTFKNSRFRDRTVRLIKDLYEKKKTDQRIKRMLNSIVGKFGSKISNNSWHYFPLHRTILMLSKIKLLRTFWQYFLNNQILFANTDSVILKILKEEKFPFINSDQIGCFRFKQIEKFVI